MFLISLDCNELLICLTRLKAIVDKSVRNEGIVRLIVTQLFFHLLCNKLNGLGIKLDVDNSYGEIGSFDLALCMTNTMLVIELKGCNLGQNLEIGLPEASTCACGTNP